MKALRIAICEDVPADAALLKEFIRQSGMAAEITVFADSGAFLRFSPSGKFDLIFMDIYMSGASGIDAARVLRQNDKLCQIVLVTASTEHALEGYGVDAMQYLVKPGGVTAESVRVVLERARRVKEKLAAEVCTVVADGQRHDIPLNTILYAEIYDKNCHIHILNASGRKTVVTLMRFDELAVMLTPPRFLRCHRSYIVNLEHVAKIRDDITMNTGDIVYVRRGDHAKCKQALNEWRLREHRSSLQTGIT